MVGLTGVWAGASNPTGTQIFHNNTVYALPQEKT
jgi:hypothetical protein